MAAQPRHLLVGQAGEALEDEVQLVLVALAGEQRQPGDQLRQQAACMQGRLSARSPLQVSSHEEHAGMVDALLEAQ